jgi:hypothetical protein
VRKTKRDVFGYIDASIDYDRGNSKAAPGGYASGLDKAEADLVYVAVGGRWRRSGPG